VLTDDQDVELHSLEHMPKLQSLIADKGVEFKRMYASVPVCCPSRSSLYSSRYQHNNFVKGNAIPTNCSSAEWQSGPEKTSFPVYLQAAGYATSFAGKYLNLYGDPKVGGVAHIPPGWTNWNGLVGNSVYYNYTISANGVRETHKDQYSVDYLPDLVLNKTLAFLDSNAASGKPFFVTLSTPSCHGPQEAAPQYQGLFPDVKAPRTPRFNATVENVHWLQSVKAIYPFDDNSAAFSDLVFRRRLQTLQSVDDMIEALVEKVSSLGQLNNTYFVYTADNGYHVGDFGFIYDKRQPWETDVHLPLLMAGPGIPPGTTTDAMVSMADLGATFLDIANAPIPSFYDGVSLLPAAQGTGAPWPRQIALVEYHGESWGPSGKDGACSLTDYDPSLACAPDGIYRTPPFFSGHPLCVCQDTANQTYNCLRVKNASADFRYCEFVGTQPVEYFDYLQDPYELVNAVSSLSSDILAALSARLAQVIGCQGAQCSALLSTAI